MLEGFEEFLAFKAFIQDKYVPHYLRWVSIEFDGRITPSFLGKLPPFIAAPVAAAIWIDRTSPSFLRPAFL